jgi:putative SbcD/Mre11-related phosphoesterase
MRIQDGWLLTAARAAVHVPTATAVVSDLHLGYAEARRRSGEAVPAPTVADALEPLRLVFRRHQVRRLVIAGDLFESGHSAAIAGELLAWLEQHSVNLSAVVPGNHDRGIAGAAGLLPVCPDGFCVGKWRVVHGDGVLPEGPVVQGHEHLCLRWKTDVRAPCYLIGPNRLVLPAFSTDAAGVNVLRRHEWRDYTCVVIAGQDVLDFGPVSVLLGKLRRSSSLAKQ